MASFSYPTDLELSEIAQVLLPRLQRDREIFNLFPREETNDFYIAWEQMDNYVGLQNVRGLDGAAGRVKRVGGKRYLMQPGVYGDYINISEEELTTGRRMWGTFSTTINLDEIVMRIQNQLLVRELDRQEQIGWNLLTSGTFSVAAESGGVLHTDTYPLQTYDATTWGTVSTATPLADFRGVQLLGRGKSVSLGSGAVAYMNRGTANNLLGNSNAADLGGRLQVTTAGVLPLTRSINDVNSFFAGQDLPEIRVYDQGYLDDAGTFQLFIPNGKVVVVGQRPGGQRVGAYKMCRNANNPDMGPSSVTRVIDRGEQSFPRQIDVIQAHNGGLAVYFPSACVVIDVS